MSQSHASDRKAAFLGLLSKPLLTLDQVKMLKFDNLPAEGAPSLRELGIALKKDLS